MTQQSAKVTKALRLVAKGLTPYAAAKKTGIALSTIYRAQVRQRIALTADIIVKATKPL